MEFENAFKKMLLDAAGAAGKEIRGDVDELARYAAERAKHLSTLVHDPDFEVAAVAERDNVAMRAGILATRRSDAMDHRIMGMIHGALRIGSSMLIKAVEDDVIDFDIN